MKRVCFVLYVKPERLEEYKQRHRTVWPEMLAALRETGWQNYSLFLRPDGMLVGYLETGISSGRARAWRSGRSMTAGSARWLISLCSRMELYPIAPWNRWKKSFIFSQKSETVFGDYGLLFLSYHRHGCVL